MRIVSGKFKGRKLASPPGLKTRPTSGKVREALFNILSDFLSKANVLDLFAGTGAFGLEAISRGAAFTVFVDLDKKAVEVIRKNVTACRADHQAIVIGWDIVRNLHCLARPGKKFDLVFMDPPYKSNAISPALKNLVDSRTLAAGALLVIEHAIDEAINEETPLFETVDRRKYGKTSVTFMKYLPE